jgi:hypothetical protein
MYMEYANTHTRTLQTPGLYEYMEDRLIDVIPIRHPSCQMVNVVTKKEQKDVDPRYASECVCK